MSLQVILDAIRAQGAAQLRELEAHTDSRLREILASTHAEAQKLQDEACARAAAPAGRERARILHRAHLESLHLLGSVRDDLVKTALDRTRDRLAHLRSDGSYAAILRTFVEESLSELNCPPEEQLTVQLQADPRDQALMERILADMGLGLNITYDLKCWGGVVARSEDGQIVVINTLEARLERAIPYLRRYMAVGEAGDYEIDPNTGEQHAALI